MPLDCTTYVDDLTDTERKARDDLWRWLERFPDRVPALLEAVREGRMDGYSWVGTCRCVIGNLRFDNTASIRDWASYEALFKGTGFKPWQSPIEEFVVEIRPGDTPANSPVMASLERWIVQWQAESA